MPDSPLPPRPEFGLTPYPPRPPVPPAVPPPVPPAEPPAAQKPRWWNRPKQTRATPDRPCLNCGDATVGRFCPACGQRKADVRVSLRRMLKDVLDDQFSLSAALPRTLGSLFFRPGHLTREYVQGRIARYVPPFRLYLVSSLLFFIILPFIADPGKIDLGKDAQVQSDSARAARMADSVLLAHARRTGEDTTAHAQALRTRRPSAANNFDLNLGPDPKRAPGWLRPVARRMKRTEERLEAMPPNEAVRTLVAAFEENAPIGAFVMMPLFALLLKLLYLRRQRFYVEHFVFALHVHAFAFLTGAVVMLSSSAMVDAVLMIWLLAYIFLALKRMYGQGIIRTFFKSVLLAFAYSLLLIVGVGATAVMTALSL